MEGQEQHPPAPNINSNSNGEVNIQVITGAPNVKLGHLILVLHNAPISSITMLDGTENLVPCVLMDVRSALALAENIIFIAKTAELAALRA